MKNPPSSTDHGLPKRSYDFGVGGGFLAFISYRWASTIIQESGRLPSQNLRTVLALAVGFTLLLLLVDYLLWHLKFDRPTRSGLWAAAALGPYAGTVAWVELAHPVWSQVIGLGSTLLFFTAFYFLDDRLQGRRG